MRQTHKQREAAKSQRMREIRPLGYKSDLFPAKYRGKCGLSGLIIKREDPVAFFREHGVCHAAAIEQVLFDERRASLPTCSCGRKIDSDVPGGSDICGRCYVAIEYLLGIVDPSIYSRETEIQK